MSYAVYQRIKLAASRDAYLRARQLGFSALDASDEGRMVGDFVTTIADRLGATAGVVRIAIDDHHTVSLMEGRGGFYLRSEHDRARNFVAIAFAGHDRNEAVSRLRWVSERVAAKNAADEDWGAV